MQTMDVIMSVNGTDVQGKSVQDVVPMMVGQPGTRLTLSIIRGCDSLVSIVRGC